MYGEFSCSLDLIHTGMLECFFTKFASAFGGELFLLRCDVAPAGLLADLYRLWVLTFCKAL